MVVPKIIHQIWVYQDRNKDKIWAIKKFKESIEKWKSKHPDFRYIFWSNVEVYDIITEKFPNLTEKINKIDKKDIIILADIARLCILYTYGGIYSDLDIVPHRNYEKLLNTDKIIFPKTEPFGFSNDLIISPKKNKLLKNIIDNISVKNYIPLRSIKVLYSGGPLYITEQLIRNNKSFYVLPKEYYQGHLEGSTWLTGDDQHMKSIVTQFYNNFSQNNVDLNVLNELKDEILLKKNLVSTYEKIDSFIICYFMTDTKYIDNYYIFRLLDIFKSSSSNKLKKINTVIHSLYRIFGTQYLNKKHAMYSWMGELSLVSFTEMKTIKQDHKVSSFINIYVLTKHLYIIIKTLFNKKRISDKISNKKFLIIHLFESFLHFYFLTDRNPYLKLI